MGMCQKALIINGMNGDLVVSLGSVRKEVVQT